MKKIIISTAVLICFLPGCTGMDGTDGDVYIAYSWVSITHVYTDDPSFGDIITNGKYEDANTGTWYFEYTSLGYFWYGTYTVYRNEGEPFTDGEDIYFELTLYSFGPSFYEWSEEYAKGSGLPERGSEYTEVLEKPDYTVQLHVWKGE